MKHLFPIVALAALGLASLAAAQTAATRPAGPPAAASPTSRRSMQPRAIYPLADVRMRDVCILADPATKTYYMVGPAPNGVRVYASKDLRTWEGPDVIFKITPDLWGDIPVVGVWAPEMHRYNDRYYLFLTFNTQTKLAEQWRNWLPRVYRGSQVLVGSSPTGPFAPFAHHSTLPTDMMTLDGTFWTEDGKPYMIFAHEWVQITNGSMEFVKLKPDLSDIDSEPVTLFHASEAPWSKTDKARGNNVTDGPYMCKSRSGKLFMIWSSGGEHGYTTGIAISDSGKLAGPWRQQAEPLYAKDGGHGMIFQTFDDKLMMVLHSPNNRDARPRIFELQDTGETLKITGEFTGIP